MVQVSPRNALIRVVSNNELDHMQAEADRQRVALNTQPELQYTQLASYIRNQYDMMRRHRDDAVAGWSNRLMDALRAFNGQYDATKLAQIRQFGGSEVYARTIAMKCRGASSLLRDVYLQPERPWGIAPPADPDVVPEIIEGIKQLLSVEIQTLQMSGQPPPPDLIRDRAAQLMDAARQAEKKRAAARAKLAQDKIEEILNEGKFYKALSEFIVDLPLFPFACIKGPTVRILPEVTYQNGIAATINKPKLHWERVSPFDLYWTPGVADIEDADVIERTRLRRTDFNDLLDLPGYHQQAIRTVLEEYGRGGLSDDWDGTDTERAYAESRENPRLNRSGLINCLMFTGNVQGRMLVDEMEFDSRSIQDPLRDYMVQAWLVGRHVIKCQIVPSPRKRHPYYITSFEKVPGTPVGNGLPDILADIAEVTNAVLRALVNNLSVASGPQVVVNVDRASAGGDIDSLYPWKRWYVTQDPLGRQGGSDKPVDFFQPQSNAQELLGIYKELQNLADELSAIPKYMSGSGASGGAGRTAAGLAMLMGNASKILQTVAANIDRDVIDPALQGLYDMLMLTDTESILQGDESIRVLGVNVAIQRETNRARQLEFLGLTANPFDSQIMGPSGRAAVLRAVAGEIGIDGAQIVPSEERLRTLEQQSLEQAAAQAQGNQPGQRSTNDMGPRERPPNIAGGVQ